MEVDFIQYQSDYEIRGLEKSKWSIEKYIEDAIKCDPDFDVNSDSNKQAYKRDGIVPKNPTTWTVVQCESWIHTDDVRDYVACPIYLVDQDDEEHDCGFLHLSGFKEVE